MWVFLSDAFLSIVEDKAGRTVFRVRARIAGDIGRVFPTARVDHRKAWDADYRYVALVPRSEVAAAIRGEVLRIDYTNFKDSVWKDSASERARHDAYLAVWSVMEREQERRRTGQGKMCK